MELHADRQLLTTLHPFTACMAGELMPLATLWDAHTRRM